MRGPGRNDGEALARYYDLDLSDGESDVGMYLALAAATGGRVLELASGSGRIAVPLAAAGAEVTGVDNDTQMLERARAAWSKQAAAEGPASGSLRLVHADMTTLELQERFDLVIVAFNSLMLLPDRAAQRRTLEVMARHLSDDGRAIVDVWLPGPDDLALYDGRLLLDWVRRDEETGEWIAKSTSATYATAAGTAEIISFFDAWRDGEPPRRTHRRDTVTFIGRSELLALHELAGMDPQIVAGDYEMNPLEPDADRMIVVSRLDPATRGGPSVRRSNRSGTV